MGDAPTPIGPNDWVAERLAEIDRIADASKQVMALLELEAELLPSGSAVLQAALEAALAIKDDLGAKAEALSAIAPHLPQPQQHDVLQQALQAAESIDDPKAKAEVLIAIAPRLPETDKDLLELALAIVDNLRDDYSNAHALSAIAPRLPETEQKAVLERALNAADKIWDGSNKARALSEIAPRLLETDKDLLERALAAADKIWNDEYKAEALSAIAPRLPETEQKAVLERALNAADKIWDKSDKARALSAIAPRLPETEQKAVLERALAAADNIKNDEYKAYALSAIAPQISLSNLKRFLEATLSLSAAAKCLASTATRFTKEFLRLYPSNKHSTALNIVKHIPEDADKIKFLSALIPCLAVGLLPNALRLIQETFTADRYRTETLNNLVAYLPTDQTPEALNLIAQFIKNPYYQTAALVELIPLLPIECCDAVLNLLEAKIALPPHRASILQAIAKALTTPEQIDKLTLATSKASPEVAPADETFLTAYQHLVGRTLNLTYQLKKPKRDDFSYERAASSIFSQLAPVLKRLAEPEQTAVLDAVKALEDPGYRAAVLIALAPHCKGFVQTCLATYTGDDYRNLLCIKIQLAITDSTNPQALRPIADQLNDNQTPYIKSPYPNAEAWVEMASHPAGKSYQIKALRTIQELQNNAYLQSQYLQRLIPHLAYQQRLEAANIIHDISDPYHQVSARIALARKFPESEFFEPARDGALALETKVKRIEQLSTLAIDIPELLPRIIKLAETVETLKNIERYGILAALAPHLPMRINRELKRSWALSNTITDDLWDRALYLLARGYRDALQGGTLRNDAAQDRDLLDLKDEVNALSGLLLMRDLEPPMTVGILGGWGGGKSYIMHLMQAQMTAIRSRKIDVDVEAWNENPNHEKLFPYVGHIYQIKFDAWTFAKSDLWASLMQTIFTELDRQITLEQQLMSVLEKASNAQRQALEEKIWLVLYETNDTDRKWFLERVLNDSALFDEFQSQLTNPELTGFLWKKFQTSQDEAISSFTQLQAELKKAESQLNAKKAEIREREHAQFRPVVELQNSKQVQRIDALLGTSLIVLRQRIGTPLFQQLNNEVYKELQGNAAAPDVDAQKGLWKTLNETIKEYEQVSRGIIELEVKESADQDLDELKEKSEELLQKIENTKFDIYTVAATVIDREYGHIALISGWHWARRNWVLISIFVLFFVIPVAALIVISSVPEFEIPMLQWAKDLIDRGDRSIAGLAAFLATLTPGIIAFQAMLKTAQKWFEETSLALQEYQKGVENRAKVLETTIEQKIATKIQTDAELQRLENTVKQLESQVKTKRAEMPENVYASLADFVSGRLQEGSYEKSLGLMQQVKQDLSALSDRLLPHRHSDQSWKAKLKFLREVFPRGPARVVVYIDDLDRCPPDRVVQVLEAIQLLVKTPLFIAVLAIDERYITRALEQFYKGVLLRQGSPSGTDYLEKIIQLPYRVRPIMADTLETYLRSQVVIQDNATGGTKFSEFSRQEFNMLLACCKQVDLTPRTLKRLTNVYKLFKIVCRTRGNKPNVQVQQAILALLALSGRYPNLMRGIFEAIETCFEEQRNKPVTLAIDDSAEAQAKDDKVEHLTLYLQSPLKAFFENYQLPDHDRYLQLEFDKLHHDALHTDILPPTLTLEAMTHEIFNLIRSFSFVGEIGEDSKDYGSSGPVEHDRANSSAQPIKTPDPAQLTVHPPSD